MIDDSWPLLKVNIEYLFIRTYQLHSSDGDMKIRIVRYGNIFVSKGILNRGCMYYHSVRSFRFQQDTCPFFGFLEMLDSKRRNRFLNTEIVNKIDTSVHRENNRRQQPHGTVV